MDWKVVKYTFLIGNYGWHLRLRIGYNLQPFFLFKEVIPYAPEEKFE